MINGNLVDVEREEIYPAEILFGTKIIKIKEKKNDGKNFLLPGLIDSHIHIESSLLCPSRFGEVAVPHGTTAVIADPHEIANICGMEGINYMIADSTSPLKIFFTAPSCVPSTGFETNGALLDAKKIEELMKIEEVIALGEVMNFKGVIDGEKDLIEKIEMAKKYGKKIDGHAPKLSGRELERYVSFGISTDHECTSIEEAKEKMEKGMKIMIREGSSAKNLKDLLGLNYDECFLVSDDLRIDDLIKGHMDLLIRKAIAFGIEPIKAIKMATINPAGHYGLEIGSIQPGKAADLIEIDNLNNFVVKKVFINGKLVAKNGKTFFKVKPKKVGKMIRAREKIAEDFAIHSDKEKVIVNLIETVPNQIITKKSDCLLKVKNGKIAPDIENDVIKIVVLDRYGKENLSMAFVKGFGLKRGAIASSVAHDSHNIITIGTNDEDIYMAVNIVIKNGGFAISHKKAHEKVKKLELPIAGLMTDEPPEKARKKMEELKANMEELGCGNALDVLPFLSLLVIPEIKISDRGLFDVMEQKFIPLIKNG